MQKNWQIGKESIIGTSPYYICYDSLNLSHKKAYDKEFCLISNILVSLMLTSEAKYFSKNEIICIM